MRTGVVSITLAAVLLLPLPAMGASVGCLRHPWGPWMPNGVTYAEGSTRAGQPCQIGFGEMGGIIEELRIVVRPSHGVLGVAGQEGNRRYVAYVPARGFVGHDRFELYIQVIPLRGTRLTTRFRAEMNVAP